MFRTDAVRLVLIPVLASISALASGGLSAAPVSGTVTEFSSPNGVVEQCIRIQPMPGAQISNHDLKTESDYCELDLSRLALCPKLWSTSPGTILYEFDTAAHGADPERFENANCANGHHAKAEALDKPAVYKMSVNARDTSATYAPSSWIYYHFSRFLGAQVHVPVAVYRSMDAAEHRRRVTSRALSLVEGKRHLRMLAAGWRFVESVESGNADKASSNAMLTDDGRQVFGVLLDNKGDRYGPEFNGTRESGWGSGQNLDFQQTAPFLALRNPAPLAEAAAQSVHDARKNPKMASALAADTSVEQVVFWMQDVLEITLLDFILGQQDRIGNIDYTWRWYWVEEGRVESKRAHHKEPPADLAAKNPLRLRQSAINDNDAGVRRGYADFAERTHMLEGLRHYNPRLYEQLGRLAADLGAKGPVYQWMTSSAGLSTREADSIAARAVHAFELLQADCKGGKLQFDLDPGAFLLSGGKAGAGSARCEIGAE